MTTPAPLRSSRWLCALAALSAWPLLAAEPAPGAGQERPSSFKLGAEVWKLPDGERTGVIGATQRFAFGERWFVGPAVYGAASGRRGGLFVIGGEAVWRHPGPAGSRVEAGLFVGAGGGAAAPVGGGLVLRPQIDWSWPLGPGWLGVSAARVHFPSGRITSHQLGLVYTVDGRFRHAASGEEPSSGGVRWGLGIDRLWLHVGRAEGRAGARYGQGGLRVDRWLRPGLHVSLEAAGAAQGGADGYAELLAGVGAEWPLWGTAGGKTPHVGLRGALGLAGGGAVDTGGGPLVKLVGSLHWPLGRDLALGLEAGRVAAPDGRWRARLLQVSLGWVLDRPVDAGWDPALASPRSDTIEWSAAVAQFPRVRFRDGSDDAVQTLGLRVRRVLDPALGEHLQLAGSVHFAAGGHAGAYGAGLIGLAWATPLDRPGWQFGAELLAGAAGGGGVDTRGGAVLQPMLRAGWADGAQRWQLGLGQVRALRGGLDGPVIELSYGVAIGVPRQ
ncbi:MAG: hypothetical protein JNM26_11845 [Ideonella sp.]|nr:hypothetical protein [Ideonella sp.]